jgi:putative flippase GtrA
MLGVSARTVRGQVKVAKRAVRFAISGLLVTLLHVCVAGALIEFASLRPTTSNGIAFLAATLVSFALNTSWSFSAAFSRIAFARFLLVSALGLIWAVTVAWLAHVFAFSHWIGILAVAVTTPPITFLLHNFWTYR